MMGRKREHHEEHLDERWLITYADMITLLMVFFIVLYSMANTDLKKFAEVAEAMQVAFNSPLGGGSTGGALLVASSSNTGGADTSPVQLPMAGLSREQRYFMAAQAEMATFAQESGLQAQISINMSLEGVVIGLSDAMLFTPGSAEIREEAIPALNKVSEILRMSNYRVRVEGHTDDVPTNSAVYPTNWELSVSRAVAIVRHLSEQEGIPAGRMAAAGYADTRPLVPNDTRENRAMNRRADIVILFPQPSLASRAGLVPSTQSPESSE